MKIEFIKKIRGERRFSDKEKLIEQIKLDEKKAKKYLKALQ